MSRTPGRLPQVLWLLSVVFIVYGATIPFDFRGSAPSAAAKIAHILDTTPWALHAAADGLSVPDAAQNILLFVPFGILGALSLRAGGRRRSIANGVLVTLLGAALSGLVECLQLFTIDRTSSLTDLATNTFGAAAGFIALLIVQQSAMGALRQLHAAALLKSDAFYPMLVFLMVVCVSAWQPFDITLDVSTVGHKIRLLQRDVWQFTGIDDEGIALLQCALFAWMFCEWVWSMGIAAAAPVGLVVGIAVACGLEGSQLLITARQPGLEDAVVRTAGAIAGVGVWLMAPGRRSWPLPVIALATAIGAALQMLSPFELVSVHQRIQWVPFLNYYTVTTFNTVSHTIELLLIYFPLGFIAGGAGLRPERAMTKALLLALAIAAPIEYGQAWIVGRYADVTDVVMSGAGGLLGAWAATHGAVIFRELVAGLAVPSYAGTVSSHSASSKHAT